MQDIYAEMAEKIIKEQENVIGPIALEQAKKVTGLSLNWDKHEVEISGDKKKTLDQLIDNYKHLFGQASVEVCRDAVRGIISQVPSSDLPSLLQ